LKARFTRTRTVPRWRHLISTLRTAVTLVHPKDGKSPSAVPERSRGLRFLQSWYASQCDGEWEHEFGIKIATSDNPGWHVKVDVRETELEGVIVERSRRNLPGGGWLIAWSDGEVFHASCGPLSLGDVDALFETVAENSPLPNDTVRDQ
jgi:hypothetical protein